jgi:hypothetical protein
VARPAAIMPEMYWPTAAGLALLGLGLLAIGCASSPPAQTSGSYDPPLAGTAPAEYGAPADPAAAGGATAAVVRTRSAQPLESWYTGPEPCKRAIRGDSPVAKACGQGGIKSARATMKDMVKQGKAAGLNFECDDCHRDHNDHSKLQPDAPEKFQRLLAVVKR